MKATWKFVILVFSLLLYGPIAMAKYEEPSYKLIKKTDNIEIRAYKPMLIAEVTVQGDRKHAVNKGFKILADFIFGNNTSQKEGGGSEKISMTTPIVQQPSQKIAMTAPVVQQGSENRWTVHFVMPKKYTVSTLPTPNNKAIVIRTTKSYKAVVIRFSGFWSKRNLSKNMDTLNAHVKKNTIEPQGKPIYMFYNPPWTLPFMRRNEIMYKIR